MGLGKQGKDSCNASSSAPMVWANKLMPRWMRFSGHTLLRRCGMLDGSSQSAPERTNMHLKTRFNAMKLREMHPVVPSTK